jgi:RNA polymerase sigma-70 factor (ECF subfamily)
MKNPLGSGRAHTASAARSGDFGAPVLVTDEIAEEQRLVLAAREGSSDAFGSLVERFLPRALALATRVLHHREDAEDLVQDAFLSALRHIEDFDTRRPFWPWLSRIIINRGLDVSQSRAVRSSTALTDELADRHSSPAEDAERSDFYAHVRDALAALPPRRRLVVELFELEGFSIAEIAESLDTAPATIRWHLHVARRQLRSELAPLYGRGAASPDAAAAAEQKSESPTNAQPEEART